MMLPRHALVAVILTVVLIQIAQLAPLSSQSLLKTPDSTNPSSDSMATSTSRVTSASSNLSIIPNLSAWRGVMSSTPAQQAGCFVATYPSTVWQSTQCVTVPKLP